MRTPPRIVLSEKDRSILERWVRGRSIPARLVLRARIVLMAADGMMNKQIAAGLGIACKTVSVWRGRFAHYGPAGIDHDAPRAGGSSTKRKQVVQMVLRTTLLEPPLGAACWTTRTLAKRLNLSPSMIQRVWKEYGLKPSEVGIANCDKELRLNPWEATKRTICMNHSRTG